MVELRLDRLSAYHGAARALWDVSFSVRAGSLTCLFGPNGAGKTTLATAVNGTLRSVTGSVRLDGREIGSWSPERRARSGVILVPQGRRVFADLTVDENLRLAAFAAARRSSGDRSIFVYELFPRLRQLRFRRAGTLSGGEQQMLAFGRAVMAEPKVLILDEPSLGLAPIIVDAMYDAIEAIAELDVAILLIEQAVESALHVAEHVIIIDRGAIVDEGPVSDFRDGSRLAASYLGAQSATTKAEEDHGK